MLRQGCVCRSRSTGEGLLIVTLRESEVMARTEARAEATQVYHHRAGHELTGSPLGHWAIHEVYPSDGTSPSGRPARSRTLQEQGWLRPTEGGDGAAVRRTR